MNSSESTTGQDHRSWPVPPRKWSMRMNWHDLLFMHWPVPVESIRRLVPTELDVDTFEGTAWIGVVPFWMSGVAPRGFPNVPGLSKFPEVNVRTYVKHRGEKPGVWFMSLDADQWIAVRAARKFFHLPYTDAKIQCTVDGQLVNYQSKRIHRGQPEAELDVTYEPDGERFVSQRDSIEHWLTARYCMYSQSGKRIHCGEIMHPPWELHTAKCEIRRNTMVDWLGITLPDDPPMLHYSRRTDVVVWSNDRVV